MHDDRVTARTVIAADIKDETVAAGAEDRVVTTEVTGPAKRLQVRGPEAQPNPRGCSPASHLLDDCVDLGADRGKQRPQFLVAGRGLTELLNHVHGSAHLLMAGDPCDQAPRVMAEHCGEDSLTGDEREALSLEAVHDQVIFANKAAGIQRDQHGLSDCGPSANDFTRS